MTYVTRFPPPGARMTGLLHRWAAREENRKEGKGEDGSILSSLSSACGGGGIGNGQTMLGTYDLAVREVEWESWGNYLEEEKL